MQDFAERSASCSAAPRSPGTAIIMTHCGAVADKQLTEKTRNLGYKNRIKMVKHDFRNLKTRRGLQKRHGRAKRKAQGYLDL